MHANIENKFSHQGWRCSSDARLWLSGADSYAVPYTKLTSRLIVDLHNGDGHRMIIPASSRGRFPRQ